MFLGAIQLLRKTLIFSYMGEGGKSHYLTLTWRGGILIYGSSREYSSIILACLGWGESGLICIFLGGGLGEWGEGSELSDALIDQILMLN